MAFRLGHARGDSWQAALRSVIEQLGPSGGGSIGPGFVYVSDVLAPDLGKILPVLKSETGIEDWVGSVGIGVLATGVEYLAEAALAVMIADWPQAEYKVFSGRARPPALGERSSSGAAAAHFAIVHGDPATSDMPELVEDMSRKLESGFMVGGLSSSRTEPLQIANDVLRGGLSGIVLSSAIPVRTRLTQGCAPIAERHVITEAIDNVIFSIDNRPALDVFKEIAGPSLARDLNRAAHQVLVGLPVEGSDGSDYLVRNVVGIDTRKGILAIGGAVEAGQPLLFCRRDVTAARDDLVGMLDRLATDLAVPPRGGLYFSCIARGEHMFGERSAEIGMIHDRLGAFPLVGFFANGEISHDRLYGYTGVLTLFG